MELKNYTMDGNLEILTSPSDKDIMEYQHNSVALSILFPADMSYSTMEILYNNMGVVGTVAVTVNVNYESDDFKNVVFAIPQPLCTEAGTLKMWLVQKTIVNRAITKMAKSQTMLLNVVASENVTTTTIASDDYDTLNALIQTNADEIASINARLG